MKTGYQLLKLVLPALSLGYLLALCLRGIPGETGV